MNGKRVRIVGLILVAWSASAFAAEGAAPKAASPFELLSRCLTTPLKLIRGDMAAFTITLKVRYGDAAGKQETGELVLTRADAERFALTLRVRDVTAQLVRESDETRLVVPAKKVAIVGKGPMPPQSDLSLATLLKRIVAASPKAGGYVGMVQAADPGSVALILTQFGQLEYIPPKPGTTPPPPPTFLAKRAIADGHLTLQATADGTSIGRLSWGAGDQKVVVDVDIASSATMPRAAVDGLKILSVPRPELERVLGRGLARAADILANQRATKRKETKRKADLGRLIVKKRYQIAILEGKPYQIGFQHGKLLAPGARRLCDSVLYVVGTYYTIEKGEWFLDVMRGAWKRLQPHIPPEYLEEMRGLAEGSQIPLESVQLANVFPALFHCSGFALLPQATETNKLYHGRILDYMVDVGLQRDAVLFVVKKHRAIPFANVGYAGFIGSVSGMNGRKVCFGEMGGRGVGKWDGTPMPILMRMGLERAGTLQEAIRIFTEAKRTCEYYYVISDAKIPDAVGVRATPDEIELLKPGQAHPLLPTPVDHCVLMSAGKRYTELVARVKGKLGKFNSAEARALMTPPVTMRSNLHNVLFMPGELALYVANARGREPAHKSRYIRHNLKDLLAKPKSKGTFPDPKRPTIH